MPDLPMPDLSMTDLSITLTCADYARVMPLAAGDVKPEGISLTLVHGSGGSWEMRAEMLRRALQDPKVPPPSVASSGTRSEGTTEVVSPARIHVITLKTAGSPL